MNSKERGLYFENKAINILELLGYSIIEHTSITGKISPYDIIAEKDSEIFFIEVKGRTGSNKSFLLREPQIKAYVYTENVLMFLINDYEYRIFNIIQMDNNEVLNGFRLNCRIRSKELLSRRRRIELELGVDRVGNVKRICKIGEKLMVLLSKDEIAFYGLKEGDWLNFSDIVKVNKNE